jgi:hypothetical protein
MSVQPSNTGAGTRTATRVNTPPLLANWTQSAFPPAGRRVRVNNLHHHIGARKTKNAPPAINANPITWFQVIAWCK